MKLKKFKSAYEDFLGMGIIDKSILNQAKKEKSIIYGARAVQKQGGIFARGTQDWDVFSFKPKTSAKKTEKCLDKRYGGDVFYVKPALHPGTYKVMHKGLDRRKGTKDDYGVADYTKMPKPKPKIIIINGIRYRKLSEEEKARRKILKDKEFAFRHEKDKADLVRIKLMRGKI